jgi:quercetin dioxygenase-like cupin family protein
MGIQHIRSADMPDHRAAIDEPAFTSTVVRFHRDPGPPGDWHTHGEQQVIAYIISGRIRIESGPGGKEITDLEAGDLVRIEPGTIHRETYEGDVAIVGFTLGPPPGVVHVEGPEG